MCNKNFKSTCCHKPKANGNGGRAMAVCCPKPTCEIKDDCCQCIKQIDSSAHFLENILDAAASIVQILQICGIHQCKTAKANDLIVYSFLHFDQYPDRCSGQIKRKIRKETLFNDLGRECQMNGQEAYMSYDVMKHFFKAFYHGQVVSQYDPGFVDECKWRHAIKRTIEAYMKQYPNSSDCYEVANRIRCVFKKYLDKVQCRADKIKTMAQYCRCCAPCIPKCPPPCCDIVCQLCHPKPSASDVSIRSDLKKKCCPKKKCQPACCCTKNNDQQTTCGCQHGNNNSSQSSSCRKPKQQGSKVMLNINCPDMCFSKICLPCHIKTDCCRKTIEISIQPEMVKTCDPCNPCAADPCSDPCANPCADPCASSCTNPGKEEPSCAATGDDEKSVKKEESRIQFTDSIKEESFIKAVASSKFSERELSGYDPSTKSEVRLNKFMFMQIDEPPKTGAFLPTSVDFLLPEDEANAMMVYFKETPESRKIVDSLKKK